MPSRLTLRRAVLSAVLSFAAACSSACAPAVQNITVKSSAPIATTPDLATIVVIQPTTHFAWLSILDAKGTVLGQLHDRSYTAFQLPPGPFQLYAVVEKSAVMADRIEGTVEAGRTYFATIGYRYAGVAFRALNPRSLDNRWSQREEFLANTPHVQMDVQKVPTVQAQLGDPKPILTAADEYVAKLDEAHRAERTVLAADGL